MENSTSKRYKFRGGLQYLYFSGEIQAIAIACGELLFEPVENWEKLPPGWNLIEVAGVAVDARDDVYVLSRGEHPVVVLDRDGNFLRSFGEGLFSARTHGIHIGPDGMVYCADDGLHTIQKFTPEGKLLMTLGTPKKPAPRWSGEPFHQPTHAAMSAASGNLYVTDGYGNARVHKFSPDGRHLFSWGSPGIDAGQFMLPHNVAIDREDRVYVADREANRVQVFDRDGAFLAMWHNVHRPDCICLDAEGHAFVGEINGTDVIADAPGLGHRVSVYDLQGKLLGRIGEAEEGEGPAQFIAPHGIAVDSRGDLYVGEVSFTVRRQHMRPRRYLKCLRKFRRIRR
jgi:DNA-binding beta-propeller fold protein YncE